eukprot:2201407-Rhodomonas_salina.3
MTLEWKSWWCSHNHRNALHVGDGCGGDDADAEAMLMRRCSIVSSVSGYNHGLCGAQGCGQHIRTRHTHEAVVSTCTWEGVRV